jgi:hypothetical protein
MAGNGIASTGTAILAACVAVVAVMSTAAAQEYGCHFSGQRYAQGEIACIRGQIARCGKYLTNSSWNFSAEMCTPGENPRVWTPRRRGAENSPGETEN